MADSVAPRRHFHDGESRRQGQKYSGLVHRKQSRELVPALFKSYDNDEYFMPKVTTQRDARGGKRIRAECKRGQNGPRHTLFRARSLLSLIVRTISASRTDKAAHSSFRAGRANFLAFLFPPYNSRAPLGTRRCGSEGPPPRKNPQLRGFKSNGDEKRRR